MTIIDVISKILASHRRGLSYFLLTLHKHSEITMPQSNTNLPYDKTDKYAIWDYSKRLLGQTLNEAVGGIDEEDNTGKGRLGQMVERYFFGYEPNSNPTPDFEEAGMELKCTPLK